MLLQIIQKCPHVSPIKLSEDWMIKTRFSVFCTAADVWSAAVSTYAVTGSGAYLTQQFISITEASFKWKI